MIRTRKSNMKLLYFVQYFCPEKTSGGNLVDDILEAFAKYGWLVEVYTPMPTRGITAEERKQYYKQKTESLYNGNLIIHRMPLYREGKSFIPRAIRYIVFSFECLWKGLTQPADFIFTGSGPPSQGVVGGLIRKLTRKRFIYNLQDIFPDSMVTAGICSEKSFPYKIGEKMERFTYESADAIITVSDGMLKNILAKGAPPEKAFCIRNWIDTTKIYPIEKKYNSLFDELELDRNKFYVTYAGNLGYVQGVSILVEAAEKLKKNEDIYFVIFGNGSEEDSLRAKIKKKQLSNILLMPLLPTDRLSEVYSLGDASLISCHAGVGETGMPSKTWIIMACGTAVLASFDVPSELTTIIDDAQCGLYAPADDVEALAEQICELYDDRDKCCQMGCNARQYAENKVDRQKAVNEYIQIIEKSMTDAK